MRGLKRPSIALAVGAAVFALFAWQAITTAGRSGPLDAGEYLLNAAYIDAHGWLPPDYVSYEYSAPPLFEFLAVGAEHAVRALPVLPLELPWNLATRLLWLALVVASITGLTAARRGARRLGAGGLALAALWALDEAVALGKSERWSAGQLIALASALGLAAVSGLIGREVWPGHPRRALAAAGFVLAYPVVLRLGALFHPETTMALLSALAVLAALRAERSGWPLRLGAAAGVLCGLALLTRQSAVVVLGCILAAALWVGRRRAARFAIVTAGGALLVAGPWLGYAAATWGNPLQGNLERPGGMVAGGEPLSFYVSFPFASLVGHPYRERFANELLPQLHADLWSDWFGAFHPNAWGDPSTLDRVTASSQSVLGLFADGLALGGLALIAVPALVRVAGRRRGGESDAALALLALLAIVGFVALVAQIVRYPQVGGKEIKASYLMFAAPAFAVFSVASWLAIVRRRPRAGGVLTALAALYVLSYGAALASALGHSWSPNPNLAVRFGYVDLRVSVPAISGDAALRSSHDFTVWVENAGNETAFNVKLVLRLSPGMELLGPPYYERGSGCSGRRTVDCELDFLERDMGTPIRFSVVLTRSGVQTLSATATSTAVDARPDDNRASVTFSVP